VKVEEPFLPQQEQGEDEEGEEEEIVDTLVVERYNLSDVRLIDRPVSVLNGKQILEQLS
jgi:hypothetical protein